MKMLKTWGSGATRQRRNPKRKTNNNIRAKSYHYINSEISRAKNTCSQWDVESFNLLGGWDGVCQDAWPRASSPFFPASLAHMLPWPWVEPSDDEQRFWSSAVTESLLCRILLGDAGGHHQSVMGVLAHSLSTHYVRPRYATLDNKKPALWR